MAEIKEHSMLFNQVMMRATLERRKKQTRRIVTKANSICPAGFDNLNLDEALIEPPSLWCPFEYLKAPHKTDDTRHRIFSRVAVGDIVWVKETHYRFGLWYRDGITPTGKTRWRFRPSSDEVKYGDDPPYELANGRNSGWHKRPSIFIPRWASRMDLEITNIRAQRIQDISTEDILAEGVDNGKSNPTMGSRHINMQRMAFETLWDSINAARGYPWSANNLVWVRDFRIIKGGK